MLRTSRTSTSSRQGNTGIVVEGLDSVVTEFSRKADRIRPQAATVVVKAAERAAERIRDRVPIDEGDLLDSITADQRATFEGSSVYADAGPDPAANAKAFVGPMIEHGTVKMGPRPFVAPAERETSPEFAAALKALT